MRTSRDRRRRVRGARRPQPGFATRRNLTEYPRYVVQDYRGVRIRRLPGQPFEVQWDSTLRTFRTLTTAKQFIDERRNLAKSMYDVPRKRRNPSILPVLVPQHRLVSIRRGLA